MSVLWWELPGMGAAVLVALGVHWLRHHGFPHLFHRDPDWQQRGLYAYFECRCGARRVRRVVLNHHGPVDPGWPQTVDRHGRPTLDSGWQQPAKREATA